MYILCWYGMVANVLYTLALAKKLPILRVHFVGAPGTIAIRVNLTLTVFRFLVFDFASSLLVGLTFAILHL